MADEKKIIQVPRRSGASKHMRAKELLISVLIFLSMAFLIAKLFLLQIVQGESLQSKAVSQQLSDVALSANRGGIYDADGTVLALTREVYTVVMAPCNIKTEETRVKIADELSVMLEVDRDKLYEQTTDSKSQYKVVKTKIEKALGDQFIEWVNENRLSGVFRIITDYKREYPLKNLLSCTLGFVGKDGVAREGLELKYDDVLSGVAGRMVIAQNSKGDALPNSLQYEYTVDAEDGNSLKLTVRQYVQEVTEKYLEEALTQYDARNRGCAIVMDVETGAILALAVKGDYDPNNYTTITDPTEAEKIAQLSGDAKNAAIAAALSKQYRNKVLDFYEPGSVFKTFTASMALEESIVSENDKFYCGGSIQIMDRLMRCWVYPNGHGRETFLQAIANSCNPVFMTVGTKIGPALFSKYYVGFGFTEKTDVDLFGEQSVSQTLYHLPSQMSTVDVATSSIGQTFKVTPLQMVTALSAVANGGSLMRPYIVQETLDKNGNVITKTEPTVRRQVVSADTAKRVAAMLENAVSSGAIRNAYLAGYRVAGKTGTSEKTETKSEATESTGKDEDVQVVASFGGFAPADDPKVAILVMVDEPQILKSGGGIAAPLAKKILKEILPYLGVEPSYTQSELQDLDRSMPNVVGKTTATATKTLTNATLTVHTVGNGSTVVSQIPVGGTSVPKNGAVWLYTDDSEVSMTAVPDFKGKTVAQVTQTAESAGLNILFSGISHNTSGTATSSGQSLIAGTQVPKGTVLTVEFSYSDSIF